MDLSSHLLTAPFWGPRSAVTGTAQGRMSSSINTTMEKALPGTLRNCSAYGKAPHSVFECPSGAAKTRAN